jgi:hypothetical protein
MEKTRALVAGRVGKAAYWVAVAVGLPAASVRVVTMGAARALVVTRPVVAPFESVSATTVGVEIADGVLVMTAVGTPSQFVSVVTCGAT